MLYSQQDEHPSILTDRYPCAALLFGFFESILKTKDTASLQVASNFLTEKWKSLSIDGIYETWLEEITELTARLDSVLSSGGDVEAALVSEFNDENQQREYIQFLRVCTLKAIPTPSNSSSRRLRQPTSARTESSMNRPWKKAWTRGARIMWKFQTPNLTISA